MMQEIPDGNLTVFKYRPINRYLIESLVKPSLYFCTPERLNDPFDCQLDLEKIFNRELPTTTEPLRGFLSEFVTPPALERWKGILASIGVCSFSTTPEDALMWSHYAEDHKGVCVTYSLPYKFLMSPHFQLTALGDVTYSDNPVTNFLKSTPTDYRSFIEGLMHVYLKSKSPPWQYEREQRIMRRPHGVCEIPGEFVTQIIFGLRTPAADLELVKRLALDYTGCTVFGKMTASNSDFGISATLL
jgi:hypothetical protein